MTMSDMKVWSGLPMSQSTMACGLKCEMYWFLLCRWHLRRKTTKWSAPMKLGTIVHRFMKEGQGNEQVVKDWVRARQDVLAKMIEDGEDLDGGLVAQMNGLTDLYHKAEAVVHLFWGRYPRGENRETVLKEERFEVDDVCGTVDEIERYVPTGDVAIRDTKTTGRKLETILTGYQYGLQLRVYRYLAESWCSENGYPAPRGFVVDALAMPAIKLCGKDVKQAKADNCTPEEAYLRRVKLWYEDSGKQAMVSMAMPFTEPVITEELDHAFETIRELSRREPEPQAYKKDVTLAACTYNDTQCPYYELCRRKPSMWPVEIDRSYEVFEEETRGDL